MLNWIITMYSGYAGSASGIFTGTQEQAIEKTKEISSLFHEGLFGDRRGRRSYPIQ